MLQIIPIGTVLIVISIIPLLFLLYTMTNLERLGISINHPRVIVELLFFLGLLVAGLYLWATS